MFSVSAVLCRKGLYIKKRYKKAVLTSIMEKFDGIVEFTCVNFDSIDVHCKGSMYICKDRDAAA